MKLFALILLIFSSHSFSQTNFWKLYNQEYFNQITSDKLGNLYLSTMHYGSTNSLDTVFKSTDNGNSWYPIFLGTNSNSFPPVLYIDTNNSSNGRIILDYGIDYISFNYGQTWQELDVPNLGNYRILSNGDILAFKSDYLPEYKIFRSINDGLSWDTIATLPTPATSDYKITDLEIDIYNNIYITILYNSSSWPPNVFSQVFKSSDNGITWILFYTDAGDYFLPVEVYTTNIGDIFIRDPGLNFKTIHFCQNGELKEYNFLLYNVWQKSSSEIYIGEEYLVPHTDFVYTYNSGLSWQSYSTGLEGLSNGFFQHSSLCVDNLGYLFLSSENGLYKSNFTTERVFSKPYMNFAEVRLNDTLYKTITILNPYSFDLDIDSIVSQKDNFWVSNLESDYIESLDSVELTLGFKPNTLDTTRAMIHLYSEKINAQLLVTGVSPSPSLFTIPNQSLNFGQLLVDSSSTLTLKIHNNSNFNDLEIDSIYLLNNDFFSLEYVPEIFLVGPQDTIELLINFHPTYQYVFKDTLVINTNISELFKQIEVKGTGVNPNEVTHFLNELKFDLSQNYPNPFNPSTIINYQLPKTGNVTLKVFDVLGREVATLVDEYRNAGSYNVQFTMNNLPAGRQGVQLSTGIYFYQLKAGEFVETKKMLLLK